MGGLCSRSSTVDNAPSGIFPHANGHLNYGSGMVYQSRGIHAKTNSNSTPSPVGESVDKQLREPVSFPEVNSVPYGVNPDDIDDGIPRLSRALSHKSRSTKSKQVAVAKVGTNTKVPSPPVTSSNQVFHGNSYSTQDKTEREMQAKAKGLAHFKVELNKTGSTSLDIANIKFSENRHNQSTVEKNKYVGEQSVEAAGDFPNRSALADYDGLESSSIIIGLIMSRYVSWYVSQCLHLEASLWRFSKNWVMSRHWLWRMLIHLKMHKQQEIMEPKGLGIAGQSIRIFDAMSS